MTAEATPLTMPRAPEWLAGLPPLRGKLVADVALGDICWFRVGGPADIVFMPADVEDLAAFLAALPLHVPLTVLGAGSNVLVRDGGIRGAVIRLGAAFGERVLGVWLLWPRAMACCVRGLVGVMCP